MIPAKITPAGAVFSPMPRKLSLFSLLFAALLATPQATIANPPPARVFSHPDFSSLPAAGQKRILFVTDDGEHGWMQHEHTAGAILFAKRLAAALPGADCHVLRDSFPDAAELDRASCVVLFCSGSERHPLNSPSHRSAMETAMQAGKGLVVLHWALEAESKEGSDFLARHLGGFFELHYSVNPMWKADFRAFPAHSVTRGLEPFVVYDEFYFNMRFPDVPGTRTPLAEAVPPKKVILLPEDGPRTNNPVVRASLGKPQVLAWAFERPGGGRSFGFTGGHFHWDWKHDQQRRLVLNAIAWCAGWEIPAKGIQDTTPSDAELMENQDSPPANGWQPMPGQPPRDTPEP